MTDKTIEDIIYVTYEGGPEARFDRSFYVESHLPLVMRSWEPHGLRSVRAFFPATGEAGTIAICECVFRDREATAAAFGAAETPAVMADVAHFTDLRPQRLRAGKVEA